MKSSKIFNLRNKRSKVITTAIHSGHQIRSSLTPFLNITESDRLREEDPFTDKFALFNEFSSIIVNQSRFEFDLNRNYAKAIYLTKDDAWGLDIWKTFPGQGEFKKSKHYYNKFYEKLDSFIEKHLQEHQKLIVLDIHSYNYRRLSPEIESNPLYNPDINLGTGTINDIEKWSDIITYTMDFMKNYELKDKKLSVGENVKFSGGYFPFYLNSTYGDRLCCLSIEFKKIFMDEWTAFPYDDMITGFRDMVYNLANELDKKI